MTLLQSWLEITAAWRDVFPQQRTTVRAIRHGLGSLVCLGRRTVTRILWTNGRENLPWQAEYHLLSRSKWDPKPYLPHCRGRLALLQGNPCGGGHGRHQAAQDGELHQAGFHAI